MLLNNGNGTFAAKVDYATGMEPRSVATADLNGDGKPDLAVTNEFTADLLENRILKFTLWLLARPVLHGG